MIQKVTGVQFHPWDQVYHFDGNYLDLKIGDQVIVKLESGSEIGKVVSLSEIESGSLDSELGKIIRRANSEDLQKSQSLESKKPEVMSRAKEMVKKHGLEMKLIDCFFSFDGGRLTLIFTAEGRVDFRELVRDMARVFQKSIRLQQIGIRDEARRMGGIGPCGRELCCSKFLKDLTSVSTDYAKIQQVNSRGSDRISGVCGRLMCCLGYELEFYEEEMKKYPPIGSLVKTRQGNGKVVSCNVVKKTVSLELDDNIVELPLGDIKFSKVK